MLTLIATIRIAPHREDDCMKQGWAEEGPVPNLQMLRITSWTMRDNTMGGGPCSLAAASPAADTLVEYIAKRVPDVIKDAGGGNQPFLSATALTLHSSL